MNKNKLKNLSYWQRRMLQIEMNRDRLEQRYIKQLHKRSDEFSKVFQNEVNHWLDKYAKNDGLSREEAQKLLSKDEQRQWKMKLSEFRKKAKAGGYDKELNREYFKSRINRVQQLQHQLYFFLAEQAHIEEQEMADWLESTLHETYLRNIYEITDRGHISISFDQFSDKQVRQAIYQTWTGSNFSRRVWKNYLNYLPKKISKVFPVGFLNGWGTDRVVDLMMEGVDKNLRNRMITLVQTESAHIAEIASQEAYKETGVKKYQWMATLEIHTCDHCAKLDGKVFEVGDKKAKHPPDDAHPNCRCTTVPYIEGLPLASRWARDPMTGRGKRVANQTFNEWAKENVTPEIQLRLKKERNRLKDEEQRQRYIKFLGDKVPNTLAEFQELKYSKNEEWWQIVNKANLEKDLDAGKISLKINQEKQNRHRYGSKEYNSYVSKNKSRGKPAPSYLLVDNDVLQEIINDNYLKGNVRRLNKGKQFSSEIVLEDKGYGVAVSQRNNQKYPTNYFKIHFSKTGTHIVPVIPTERRKQNES